METSDISINVIPNYDMIFEIDLLLMLKNINFKEKGSSGNKNQVIDI